MLGQIKGSPAYMSPEQAEGRIDQIGPASDIYGLGATLYTILTGKLPFADMGIVELLDHVKRGDFPRPRQVRGDVAPALEAVCLMAMRLKPSDRYVTALGLAADLEHWLADDPVSAWREPWTSRARRWLKRHRTMATSGLTTLLALLVMLAGFLVRLNVEKHKLEEANTALQAAKDDLKTTNDRLVAANDNLEENNRQLKTARDEAVRNLQQAFGQIEETILLLERPDIAVYRHDPVYGLLQKVFADQLNRFAANAPKSEFGDQVRLVRDNERLRTIDAMQQTDISTEFRDRLATTRAGLQDYLRKHPADTWGESTLASTYLIEAHRRSLTEPSSEVVVKLLFDAFDLFERHANIDDSTGIENAFCAAKTVALLSDRLDGSRGTETKAKVVLDHIERTLEMLDRFDMAAVQSGRESGPYQRYLVFLARLQVLYAKANAFYWLKDWDGGMRTAAKAVVATATKCPREWSQHPSVLRHMAFAERLLALVAGEDKEYERAWTQMRLACGLMDSALQGTPGQREEADQRWLLATELASAYAGAVVLASSDRHDPATRARLSAIARDALKALDTFDSAEPAARAALGPRSGPSLQGLREELRKYRAELGASVVK